MNRLPAEMCSRKRSCCKANATNSQEKLIYANGNDEENLRTHSFNNSLQASLIRKELVQSLVLHAPAQYVNCLPQLNQPVNCLHPFHSATIMISFSKSQIQYTELSTRFPQLKMLKIIQTEKSSEQAHVH